MADHVCICNCGDVEHFFAGLKKFFIRTVMIFSTIVYIWLSYVILGRMLDECTRKWTQYDYHVFVILYILFSLLYVFVFEAVMKPFQCIWYFMVRLYRCMRFCMRYIRNHARLPTRSDFRRIFPVKRAINRNQLQPEITHSANELNDDRPPPLPPRNRVVTEPRTTMFQKLTSKVSAGVKSRTTVEDENPDLSSSHLQRPRCSTQSSESSRRRGKKLTKRSHFKNMMSKVTNLQAINEEDLDPQGASGIKVPLSILTQNSSSESETEKETSFTVESDQCGAPGQDLDYINIESDEQAPTQRVYGTESQLKPSSIRDEHNDQTSESPEQPSTSDYVPVFNLWNPTSSPRKLALITAPVYKFGTVFQRIHLPLSSFENVTQDDLCSSQEQIAFGIQIQSLERLPELESQSRPFDTDGTENQTIHQPLVSACPQISQSQTQSSTVSLSGSQEHSKMSRIQKAQGKGDQAGPSYVKLAQLEEQLTVSDIRIENKQSNPEQSALRDVSIPLQRQVSSMTGVQKIPSYQGQNSSAGVSDLQKHGRISDVQKRRLSRKHSPIPSYRKHSDSEKQSPEETLNLLQPTQSRPQFYSAENQLQASGIGDVYESSLQERGLQEKSLQEASTSKTSRTSNVLEKLKNLHKASAAGFPVAASEIRHVRKDPALPLLSDYAGEKFRGKAERSIYQKRRGSLSLVSERPVRESNIRKKKTGFVAGNTSGLSDSASGGLKTSSIKVQQILSSGCTPHSVLPWSGGTPTQAHGATTTHKTKGEDRISQQSQRNLLHLHEMYKVAAESKTFLTLALATGGLVLITDGAEEDETGADSSEQSYMYDQPTDILDLTHIEVPLPPINVNPSQDEHHNLDIPTRASSSRTRTAEESIENTPLSTDAREGLKTLSGQMQQIGESQGYTTHALPSTSTQTQVVTTPPKESEGRIGKQSQSNPLHLKETDKEETQRASYITRKLATGRLLLSNDGSENNETKAECSETTFTYDQPIGTLDLTHRKVPLLPKCKGESQASKEPIHELSTRKCITKQTVESTSRLSACASGGVESSSTQKQQIEASEGGYATHSTLPTSGGTSTPTHVLSTSLKRKEVEYRIRQLSSKDSSIQKEIEMLEAEKTETFLTLDLATGGIVMSNEREDGTEADSSETPFMYDQPMGVLDLTHIKVPSPPPKVKKASKGKKEHQN